LPDPVETSGGGGMDTFRKNAFYLLVWRAILAAMIAVVLMATSGLSLALAFLVGAHVPFAFSPGLMIWAGLLNDDSIVRVKAWRMLPPGEGPASSAGRRVALNYLTETALRFARAAAAVSIGLAASALVLVENERQW
jgi:hypothetical protein